MAVNPKVAAKFTINGDKGIVRMDADIIPLGAQTGFTLAADVDNGMATSLRELAANSLVIRIGIRYTAGLKVKSATIPMLVTEIATGSVAKLIGKPFKGGLIKSAKVKQRAIVS